MGALEDAKEAQSDEVSTTPAQEGEDDSSSLVVAPRNAPAISLRHVLMGAVVLVAAAVVAAPLFGWQLENQRKTLNLTNLRRVGVGCLTYAEDWDERMPPPIQKMPDGFTVTWPRLIRPYVLLDEAFSNPLNPVVPFAQKPLLRDPLDGHAIDTSYALNRRFWGEFVPGAFPARNLEMPERTALLVDAGRMAADGRHPRIAGPSTPGVAVDLYGDTTDRIGGLCPYPSVDGGQISVIAVDGHAVATKVLYYIQADGPHDKRLGRIGDSIYNWNGGHDNGATDTPPRE